MKITEQRKFLRENRKLKIVDNTPLSNFDVLILNLQTMFLFPFSLLNFVSLCALTCGDFCYKQFIEGYRS